VPLFDLMTTLNAEQFSTPVILHLLNLRKSSTSLTHNGTLF